MFIFILVDVICSTVQFLVLPVAAPVHVIAEVTSSSVVLLSMAGELKLAESN